MEAQNVTLAAALVAGLLSFLSPCVLPLVPIYMGYMTGTVVGEVDSPQRLKTLMHALFFVLGFSLVFVLLGVAFGLIGGIIYPIMPWVIKIGGLILIVFGLHIMGLISIPLLHMEKRLELGRGRRQSYWTSLLVGIVFAAGWTPCVGPVLSAILLLAADSQTAGQGAILLAAYALGLGMPFLAVAGLIDVAVPALKRVSRYMRAISIVSGGLLVLMGFLFLTGLFDAMIAWVNSLGQ
jgi:cytochrome c-type biogenesis protein